ncbi:MAG: phage portal protein [Planctomycetaceae bacterium]|nr:phage portal protein [Planctomycetaceae bacterium]
MWTVLADRWRTFALKARYQRVIHERLLGLTEAGPTSNVSEDPGRWLLLGSDAHGLDEPQRRDARTEARRLALHNPHARNILRLLEAYVTGPGLSLAHRGRRADVATGMLATADRLWAEFAEHNALHYSPREHARRTWRDGECFVRKFPSASWPPAVRFVDPEAIGPTADAPDSQGIVTDAGDVESRRAYLRIDPSSARLIERIDADDVLHTRIGADSNQKRGVTVFLPILHMLDCFNKWVETELLARKLQSSIVLWRKVQGSPQHASAFADGQSQGDAGSGRREPVRPGTILTTNHGTDIQFLQPNTNFSDAVPLGRVLLLCTAAGAGLPEFMLTSDASNANFASTMVAEGPAVKLFQSEQQFFAAEFTRLWRWVLSDAIAGGLLPADFFAQVEPVWTFPQLVNRDRPRERLADVRLVESRILSRAEVARRDGADPATMQAELTDEEEVRKV